MSRMFKSIDKTWNPYTGCGFNCIYCWARELVEGKLQSTPKYRENGFSPSFHPKEFYRKFKPGQFVFVSDMGDVSWIKPDWRHTIAEVIANNPETDFLLQSKDPFTFHAWPALPNIIWGTTLESNYDYGVTRAPSPLTRYLDLWNLLRKRKFVSIEPIMDLDVKTLARWVGHIKPEIVEVGADNHHHDLPEPSWEKVQELLGYLRRMCPRVIEKNGLERLRDEQG